jgi:hypothetical protein
VADPKDLCGYTRKELRELRRTDPERERRVRAQIRREQDPELAAKHLQMCFRVYEAFGITTQMSPEEVRHAVDTRTPEPQAWAAYERTKQELKAIGWDFEVSRA